MLDIVVICATLALGQTAPPISESPTPVEVAAPLLPAPPPPAVLLPTSPSAAAPPSRWLLMRALQGSYYGSTLDTDRIAVSGWAEGSFTASTADDVNTPMTWNDQANKFLLQQLWTRIDRPVVTSGTTAPTYGGRIDMIFGSDYRFTLPQRGLLFSQHTENHGTFGLYGFDPVQFYGEAYYPTIGRGLDVKVGRFYSPYGVESIEAISTPLVSRSYTFNYDPFTHTGVLTTLALTPVWTVQAGLVLGSDVFISAADNPTFIGSVQWTQPGGRNVVKTMTILGSGQYNQGLMFNNVNMVDTVWTHLFGAIPNNAATLHPEWAMPLPNSGLSYQLETLIGWEASAPLAGGRFGSTIWYSMVHYLNYQFTPRLAGVSRLEFFEDSQGQRTGFPGLYTALSGCLIFKPLPGVIIRPEIRLDYNDESKAFDGHHGLATATTDLIFRW